MTRRIWIVLFVIVALGLRLWLAQTKELSFDEFYTITLGLGIPEVQTLFNQAKAHSAFEWMNLFQKMPTQGQFGNLSGFFSDLNPPAYFLAMGPWMRLTSLSKFALRLPSVLAGLLSVIFIAQLGRRFINSSFAYFMAALSGLSSIYLFYGTLARPYMLMLMLGLMATHLMLSKRWRWYAGVCCIGMLTHLLFGLILLTHGMYLLLEKADRISLKRWLAASALPVAVAVGWAATVFTIQLSHQQNNAIFKPVPIFKLLWHHSVISRWLLYCDTPLPRWHGNELDMLTSALIWIMLVTEVFRGFMKKTGAWFQADNRAALQLGMCWFWIPMVLLTLLDVVKHSRISGTERYLFILSPGLLFIMGAILNSYSARMRAVVMSLLITLVLLNTGFFLQQRGLPTENFQGLADNIRTNLGPNDLVLVMTGYPALPALAPYLPSNTAMASVAEVIDPNGGVVDAGHLATLTQGHPRVFLVATYSQLESLQPVDLTLNILKAEGYRLDRKIDLGNIRLGGYALSRSPLTAKSPIMLK